MSSHPDPRSSARHVVFVCEHGAAKSVLAATYFNHLAEQRGLATRARARGTLPDSEIPPTVLDGLAREGLAPCTLTPTALAPEDFVKAGHVVTFDQPQVAVRIPNSAASIAWNSLPAVSADFDKARAAIFAKVEGLIAELGARDASGAT